MAFPRSPRRAAPGTLGAVVGAFKSQTTRQINHLRRTPGAPVWQRGYYERVLRDDRELDRTRDYIRDNPARWAAGRDQLDALVAGMDHRA
jgi:REP element-mobilizing transposase RayT